LKDAQLKVIFLRWLRKREEELHASGEKRTRMKAMVEIVAAGGPAYSTITNWLGGFQLGRGASEHMVAALVKLGAMGKEEGS
jgi:hypothetical protein